MESRDPKLVSETAYVRYRCFRSNTDTLDGALSPFLPDHATENVVCFSETPPAGVYLLFESFKWLFVSYGVAKALGITDASKVFMKAMATDMALLVRELVWDRERRTFQGLWKRARHIFLGPELGEANAEGILRVLVEREATGGQRVYLVIGLPVPSRETPALISIGRTVSDKDGCLDRLMLAYLRQEAILVALDWVKARWADQPGIEVNVEFGPEEIVLNWQPVGQSAVLSQRFDLAGSAVGQLEIT
ncbi:MAG: hypothetical protein K1X67_17460 [Fimbriimonadaceae bacterium]|nr:hypothetical protein [Fimbriimonadaceae bacterium]